MLRREILIEKMKIIFVIEVDIFWVSCFNLVYFIDYKLF